MSEKGWQDGEGNKYFPPALSVSGEGKFINRSSITCAATNRGDEKADGYCYASFDMPLKNIANTGTITGIINVPEIGNFKNMVSCRTASAAYPTNHDWAGNAYYFGSYDTSYWYDYDKEDYVWSNDANKIFTYTPLALTPNQIVGEFLKKNDDGSTPEWRRLGYYDADGFPVTSYNFIQKYYTMPSGGILTEDEQNPTMYLYYGGDNAYDTTKDLVKSAPTDNDVIAVSDGKSHTFNVNPYCFWFTSGDVTINGNVQLDLAVFANLLRAKIDPDTGIVGEYGRDSAGNLYVYPGTDNASVTVNGDAGFVSLNQTYHGDVTINGNATCFGYYFDAEVKDGERVRDEFYGAKAKVGKVIAKGTFDNNITPLEGFRGHAFYEDTCYSMTDFEKDGEAVHGTSAAVDDNALLLAVTNDNLPEDTFPCVKASDESTISDIRGHLTDTSSKLLAMDIRLITDYTQESEPSAAVNLYIDDLSGFTSPAVFHIRDNGTYEKLGVATEANSVTVSTNQFSTYFIAEDQNLKSSGSGGIVLPVSAAPSVGTKVTDTSSKGEFVVSGDHTVKYTGTTSKGKTVTIPDTITINGETYRVTAIKKNALKGNTKVTAVKIGKNVKVIGVAAFANCKNLKEVTIGAGTTTICKNTFKNCKKLSDVKLYGNNLKKVGKNAFYGVSKNIRITVLAKDKTTYKKDVKLLKSAGTDADYAYKKSSKK